MKTRPILFNTEMVRAILEGRKVVTRRPMKPQPDIGKMRFNGERWEMHMGYPIGHDVPIGKYSVGNTLYVRETFYQYGEWMDAEIRDEYGEIIAKRFFNPKKDMPIYFINTLPKDIKILKGYKSGRGYYKRPSIFMPKEHARIFMKVTDVRVERLGDMTNADAIKEGLEGTPCLCGGRRLITATAYACTDCNNSGWQLTPKVEFMQTWEDIYGNYASAQFVFVYEFKVITKE